MTSPATTDLPDVAAIIGQVLTRVPAEQQPLLIAIAERMAARRYRDWARAAPDAERAERLQACADREEEIARRVEALHPEAETIQNCIRTANPDLEEINRTIFSGRPLGQQLAIQARGERLGAATWRAFAQREPHAAHSEVYLACAELEERSALVLEAIIDAEI